MGRAAPPGRPPYPGGEPRQVYVKRALGKWCATVSYEVDAQERPDDGLAVGVDMNVGQVAASTGEILRAPDAGRLEARRRRCQRMVSRRQKGSKRRDRARRLLARASRKLAMRRRNWHHGVSRRLADSAHTVCVEALPVRGMTASARGTAAAQGRQVKAKAGLNRSILATGWGELRSMLEYKAEVVAVDPAYTSQRCSDCGHVAAENRRSQARFVCVTCGCAGNADINAALNVLASGTGATGRRGAFALATPATRQTGVRAAARCGF